MGTEVRACSCPRGPRDRGQGVAATAVRFMTKSGEGAYSPGRATGSPAEARGCSGFGEDGVKPEDEELSDRPPRSRQSPMEEQSRRRETESPWAPREAMLT